MGCFLIIIQLYWFISNLSQLIDALTSAKYSYIRIKQSSSKSNMPFLMKIKPRKINMIHITFWNHLPLLAIIIFNLCNKVSVAENLLA
jgi:hypothetical protein